MKASYSTVARKMRKMFSIREADVGEYFFDDDAVLGRVEEMSISQYFVDTPDGIMLLVFAKNLKRKFSKNIKIADVVFLHKFDGESRVIFRKNRSFELTQDTMFLTHEIKPIGYAEVTERGLLMNIPCLAVNEVVEEYDDLDDGRRMYINSSREKKLKSARVICN